MILENILTYTLKSVLPGGTACYFLLKYLCRVRECSSTEITAIRPYRCEWRGCTMPGHCTKGYSGPERSVVHTFTRARPPRRKREAVTRGERTRWYVHTARCARPRERSLKTRRTGTAVVRARFCSPLLARRACSHRNLIFQRALCVAPDLMPRVPEGPAAVPGGYVSGRTLEKLLALPASVNYDFLPFQIAPVNGPVQW